MALINPKTFSDVKVFAGVAPASDASYKNLVWENLPVADILFHVDTPTIVSIEYEVWVEEGKENIKQWDIPEITLPGFDFSLNFGMITISSSFEPPLDW